MPHNQPFHCPLSQIQQLEFDMDQFWSVFSRKISPSKVDCSPNAPHQMGWPL